MTDDDKTSDERALAALFAALVEDSPPSEVSPLEVIKLGTQQNGVERDRRIRRLKVTRNVLVAAVIAGVVVLVVPHLGGRSSSSTAAASSSSAGSSSSEAQAAAAAPASGRAGSPSDRSGQGGSGAAGELPVPRAATSAAESFAAAPSSGAPASAAGSAAGAGSSAPARSSASAGSKAGGPASAPASLAPSAASSAPAGTPDSSGIACAVLPAKAVAVVRAVFPYGYFGVAAAAPGCGGRYAVQLPISADPGTSLTITVERAPPGACDIRKSAIAACSRVTGSPDTFRQKNPGATTKLWVYGQGYQVLLDTGDPQLAGSIDKLIAAGHAVIKSLG